MAARKAQLALLDLTSTFLMAEPRVSSMDDATKRLMVEVDKCVATGDPEFILKLALYLRDDLNIRSTANFMLAYAAHKPECRPYLRAYMPRVVRLPSDWIAIATMARQLKPEAGLPAALRKALVDTFFKFSEFHLSKYNNAASVARARKRGVEAKDLSFTLKRLVAILHISEPREKVMKLLGRRYPESARTFRESGLPGSFDAAQAGRRMKLTVAKTWETQVSSRGNKAEVWQDLLDTNALPFMAMLRNLRNMLQCGVTDEHHAKVISKLRDPHVIANCRQFPFRFLSAYDAIDFDPDAYLAQLTEPRKQRPAAGGTKRRAQKPKPLPPNPPTARHIADYRNALDEAVKLATMYNVQPIRGATVVLCHAFMHENTQVSERGKALRQGMTVREAALLLSLMFKHSCEACTFCLFQPRVGRTIVNDLQPGKLLHNVALLQQRIEDEAQRAARRAVSREAWTASQDTPWKADTATYPRRLWQHLRQARARVDNFVMLVPGTCSLRAMEADIELYRAQVHAAARVIRVNASASTDTQRSSAMQVITGFSDAVLRFVAAQGDAQLDYVNSIDRAKRVRTTARVQPDIASTSRPRATLPVAPAPAESLSSPAVKPLRVFISSTFTDMASERDLFQRHVLPALRQRCAATGRRVRIVDVDLRWGVTAAEAHQGGSQAIARCLQEVLAADIVVAFLGERYGWVPAVDNAMAAIATSAALAPLSDLVAPGGMSMTEMELRLALAQATRRDATQRVFVYLRTPIGSTVPAKHVAAFRAGTMAKHSAVRALRRLVATLPAARRAAVVCDKYKAVWRPPAAHHHRTPHAHGVVRGLRPLRDSMVEDLWAAVVGMHPIGAVGFGAQLGRPRQAPGATIAAAQARFAAQRGSEVVGHTRLVQALVSWALGSEFVQPNDDDNGGNGGDSPFRSFEESRAARRRKGQPPRAASSTAVLASQAGIGKTALLAAVTTRLQSHIARTGANVVLLSYFVDAMPGAGSTVLSALTSLCASLRRLCPPPQGDVSPTQPIDTYDSLRAALPKLLRMALAESRIVIVLDGIDAMQPASPTATVASAVRNAMAVLPSVESARLRILVSLQTDATVAPSRSSRSFARASVGRSAIAAGMWFALRRRRAKPVSVRLRRLQHEEAAPLVRAALMQHGKKLEETSSNNQMRRLLRKRDAMLPLYLRLAVAQLLSFGHFEGVSEYIQAMPPTAPRLCVDILRSMEATYSAPAVARACALLATARSGLAADEVQVAARLNVDDDTSDGSAEVPLPSLRWQALLGALLHFCQVTGPDRRLSFRHAVFAQAVHERYLRLPGSRRAAHQRLCKLFVEVGDPFGNGSWAAVEGRPVAEALHHAVGAAMWSTVVDMLTNLGFIAAAVEYNLVPALQLAFDAVAPPQRGRATASMPSADRRRVMEFGAFVSAHGAALSARAGHPSVATESVFQLACNWVEGSSPQVAGMEWRRRGEVLARECEEADGVGKAAPEDVAQSAAFHGAWLDRVNKDASSPACAVTGVMCADGVSAVAVSGDGKLVATACGDWSVVLASVAGWDSQTRLTAHTAAVRGVTFSPDGTMVVSCGEDNLAIVWSVADGRQHSRFKGHRKAVNGAAFLADGRHVVTASDDCTLAVWSCDTGTSVGPRLRGHSRPVSTVAATTDGEYVASGSWDGAVIVWQATTSTTEVLRQFRTLPPSGAAVRCVAWAPTTVRKLAASYFDGSVRVVDTEAGAVLTTLRAHLGPVSTLAFNADGTRLVTGGEDATLRLWRANAAGGQLRAYVAHNGSVTGCALLGPAPWVTRGNMGIVTVSEDGTWKGFLIPDTTAAIKPHPLSPITSLQAVDGRLFVSMFDGRVVTVGGGDKQLSQAVVMNAGPVLRTGGVAGMRPPTMAGLNAMESARPALRRQTLAGVTPGSSPVASVDTVSFDGSNESKGREGTTADGAAAAAAISSAEELVSVGGVLSMCVSTYGNWVVTSYSNGAIRVWSREGNLHRVIATTYGAVRVVRVLPSPPALGAAQADEPLPTVVIGTVDGVVAAYELHKQEPRLVFSSMVEREVSDLVVHPSGQYLVVGLTSDSSSSCNVLMLSTTRGRVHGGMHLAGAPTSLVFVEGGGTSRTRVAVAGSNGVVEVIQFKLTQSPSKRRRGTRVAYVKTGHSGSAMLAVAPTGQLVVASEDRTVTLWTVSPNPRATRAVSTFTCESPCAAVATVGDTVVVGDDVGRLYCLQAREGYSPPVARDTPVVVRQVSPQRAAPKTRRSGQAREERRVSSKTRPASSAAGTRRQQLARCTDTVRMLQAAGLLVDFGIL